MIRKLIFRRSAGLQLWSKARTYCQSAGACWKCKGPLGGSGEIFCASCNSIQKVPKIDFFSLFGIDKQHTVDSDILTSKFRILQSQIHPDKFSGKSEDEQTISADWSSFINKAYKTLQTPLERGEYLLNLNGVKLPEDNTISDSEFLSEMMEKFDEVENASTKKQLTKILEDLRNEMTELSEGFAKHHSEGKLDDAKLSLVKMRYLTSIEKSIKEKLLGV